MLATQATKIVFPLAGRGPNRKIDTDLLCHSIHLTIKVNRYSLDVKCQELRELTCNFYMRYKDKHKIYLRVLLHYLS